MTYIVKYIGDEYDGLKDGRINLSHTIEGTIIGITPFIASILFISTLVYCVYAIYFKESPIDNNII